MAQAIAVRQSMGSLKPKHESQPWPLGVQLERDGNDVLIDVAERYRTIYDAAVFEPQLVGQVPDENLVYDSQTYTKEDGTIVHLGVRKSRPKKIEAANDNEPKEQRPKKVVTFKPRSPKTVARKWTGDNALIAHIDASRILRRLQSALGPLVEPFEDAVLHGATLTSIGAARGIGQHAPGAGRALVMMGLEVAQAEFAKIDREERAIA